MARAASACGCSFPYCSSGVFAHCASSSPTSGAHISGHHAPVLRCSLPFASRRRPPSGTGIAHRPSVGLSPRRCEACRMRRV
eukprot:9898637-Alexandrium_andersonii.AAC.1